MWPDMDNGKRFTMTDKHSGDVFPCSENQSLLLAMVREGKTIIPVGCRGGGCGCCMIRVLAGSYTTKKMSKQHISLLMDTQQIVLACRTFPASDLAFEVWDRDKMPPINTFHSKV